MQQAAKGSAGRGGVTQQPERGGAAAGAAAAQALWATCGAHNCAYWELICTQVARIKVLWDSW